MRAINLVKTSLQIPLTYENPLDVFLLHIFRKKTHKRIKLKNGLKFFIRTEKDEHRTLNEIFIDKPYHAAINELRPTDTFVDIGGHIGLVSILAAQKVKKVIVTEPCEENNKLLTKNTSINKIKNVLIFKYAISDQEKRGRVVLHPTNSGGNTVKTGRGKNTIKIITLNKLLRLSKTKKVGLLKIDCEGCETKIIQTITKKDAKNIRAIILEFHTKTSAKKISSHLNNVGYKNVLIKNTFKNHGIIYAR